MSFTMLTYLIFILIDPDFIKDTIMKIIKLDIYYAFLKILYLGLKIFFK